MAKLIQLSPQNKQTAYTKPVSHVKKTYTIPIQAQQSEHIILICYPLKERSSLARQFKSRLLQNSFSILVLYQYPVRTKLFPDKTV